MPLDPQWQYEVHTPPSVSPSRHAHSHKPPLPTPTTSRPVASLRLTPEALAAIRASPNAISVRFTNAPTSRSTSKVSQASGLVIGTQIFEFTPLSSTPMSQRKSHNSSVPSTEIYRLDSSSTGAARRKLEYQGKVSSTIALRMTLSKEKKLQVQKAVNLEGKKRESHGAILVDALELEREAFASAAASARKLAPRPKTTTKSLSARKLYTSSSPVLTKSTPIPTPSILSPALPVRTKVMSPEAQIEFRKNLVHLMALKPISVSDILKRMGRDLEAHVMLLLKDIAKLQESNGLYKLQNQTYREVQPYTWPTYTYKEQELVAGNIKIAFSYLKLPADAPEWNNLKRPREASLLYPNRMLGSRVSVKDEKKAVMVKRKRTDKPVASSLSSVVGAKKLENDSVTPSKPIKRRRTMNSLSSFKKPPLNNLTVSKAVSVSSKTVTRSVPKKRIVKPREASPYMDPARVSTSPTLKANVLGKRVAKSNKWEDPLPPIMNHSTGEMVSVPAKKKTLMEATMMKVDSPIISAAKLKVSPVAPTPNSLQKPSTLRTAKSLNMSVKTGSELSSVKSVPVNGSFGEPLESLVKKVVNATPALITPRVEPPLSEFKDSQFKDAMTPVTGRRSYGIGKIVKRDAVGGDVRKVVKRGREEGEMENVRSPKRELATPESANLDDMTKKRRRIDQPAPNPNILPITSLTSKTPYSILLTQFDFRVTCQNHLRERLQPHLRFHELWRANGNPPALLPGTEAWKLYTEFCPGGAETLVTAQEMVKEYERVGKEAREIATMAREGIGRN